MTNGTPGGSGDQARVCACGHPETAHQHYRAGTDCALCNCPRFRSHAGGLGGLGGLATGLSAAMRSLAGRWPRR